MRSGFCSSDQDHLTHDRCRLDGCSCSRHDADVLAKAAALTEQPVEVTFLHPLSVAVEQVMIAAQRLAVVAAGIDATPEHALRSLHALRGALSDIRDVDAALVTHIYLTSDHGDVTVEGLPPVKVVRRKDRKNWDSRGAVFDYLRTRLAETDGEYPDPAVVATWILELVGVSYCRTTALKAYGLEPQDYCTETPGSLSVTFVE